MNTTKPTAAPVPEKPQKMAYLGNLEEQPTFVADNMKAATEELAPMNFKVAPAFRQQYKVAAATAGLSMKDLLEESYKLWINSRKAK